MSEVESGPPPPIVVKASGKPIVVSESFKTVVIAGLAVVASRALNSEAAVIAVLATGGMVATFLWSLLHRLKTWNALKFVTGFVSDDVARVGK